MNHEFALPLNSSNSQCDTMATSRPEKLSKTNYLKYLNVSTKLFKWYENVWHAYPFQFRFEEGVIGLLHPRKDHFFPIIQLILVTYYSFIWFSLYLNAGLYFKRRAYFELAFHTIWSFCWGIGASIQIHLRFSIDSLPSFYNQTVILNQSMSEKLGNLRFDKGWKLCCMIQILIAFYMQAIPAFSAILFIFLRHQPWYYFYLWPDWMKDSWLCIAAYALYDYWSIAVHLAAFGLQAFVTVAYMGTVDTTLKFLRRKLIPKTAISIREEVGIFFRLYILSTRFNECYGYTLIPCFKFGMGGAVIGCAVGLVKMIDMGQPALLSLQGTVAIFGANILLGMGMVASLIEKGSETYLKESRLRAKRVTKEERRLIGATHVFAVKVLGIYSMDRLAPLTMISVASIQIMTILVLFPHKLSLSGGN